MDVSSPLGHAEVAEYFRIEEEVLKTAQLNENDKADTEHLPDDGP